MRYTHFSTEEREKIQELRWQKISIKKIARILGRSHSSVFFVSLPFPAKVPAFGNFTNPILWSLNSHEFRRFKNMASPLLPNYLLSNRKRLALSQENVAFLLGTQSGAKVSRHERFDREPSLKTALAYEAIYQRSASELFSGLYQEVEQEVAARAKTLASKIGVLNATRQTAQKRQTLAAIATRVT